MYEHTRTYVVKKKWEIEILQKQPPFIKTIFRVSKYALLTQGIIIRVSFDTLTLFAAVCNRFLLYLTRHIFRGTFLHPAALLNEQIKPLVGALAMVTLSGSEHRFINASAAYCHLPPVGGSVSACWSRPAVSTWWNAIQRHQTGAVWLCSAVWWRSRQTTLLIMTQDSLS